MEGEREAAAGAARAGAGGPVRPSRRWRRLLALSLGLAAAALAAEIAYRATRAESLGPTTNSSYVRHDRELGWSYHPGARARHRTAEFDVAIAINARGFRGAEWTLSSARRRVLVLGDSYAFGWGVSEAESFCGRLTAGAPDWEVLNAAVSGYGTDQELLLLRRLAAELRPDLVVCVFCRNDLYENRSRAVYGKHKPWFERGEAGLVLRGQPVPRPWLERASHLYRAISKLAWERRFRAAARDAKAEWGLALELFDAMRGELDPAVPLLLLSEEDELALFARERDGIDHLDLRPVLRSADAPTRFAQDGHWNVLGHALIGRALLERMRALVP